MPPAFSLYLEAIRVAAAITVVLGHLSGARLLAGIFWQFSPWMGDAVIVFFVLSGYVIAHSVRNGHRTGQEYAAARIARIASVALPALIVTFALDQAGMAVAPASYNSSWGFAAPTPWQYLGSALFLNRIWWQEINVGSMLPYWSLNNEVWYYLIFGLAHFAPAWPRPWLVVGAALIAGPPIMALMPVWLFGVLAERVVHGRNAGRKGAWALTVVPVLVWIALLLLLGRVSVPREWSLRPEIVQDYFVAAAFSLHLVGMARLLRDAPPMPSRLAGALRWLAGSSFSLYLLHLPVAQFAAAVSPLPPTNPVQRVMLVAVTFLVPFLVAQWTERKKRVWREGVEWGMSRFATLQARWRQPVER